MNDFIYIQNSTVFYFFNLNVPRKFINFEDKIKDLFITKN